MQAHRIDEKASDAVQSVLRADWAEWMGRGNAIHEHAGQDNQILIQSFLRHISSDSHSQRNTTWTSSLNFLPKDICQQPLRFFPFFYLACVELALGQVMMTIRLLTSN